MKGLTIFTVVFCILLVVIGALWVGGVFQGDYCGGSCARIGNLCKCPQTMGMEMV